MAEKVQHWEFRQVTEPERVAQLDEQLKQLRQEREAEAAAWFRG